MIKLRKSEDRGSNQFYWLDSKHSFSFGEYHDPKFVHYGVLRVLNEDRVIPKGGFAPHSHQDMEIVSYVISGKLEHKDSLGNGSVIVVGDVQRMSAGSGITHSEYNPSEKEEVHFLQIWFFPEKKKITPSYEQKHFSKEAKLGRFKCIVSPTDKDAVFINQNISIFSCILDKKHANASFKSQDSRKIYIQIVNGTVIINGYTLQQGDAAFVEEETELIFNINGSQEAEILLMDVF